MTYEALLHRAGDKAPMNFKAKKDASIWCDARNLLCARVDRACSHFEKRCQASDDPRIKALQKVVYEMSNQFKREFAKRMDYIAKNEDEFVVKYIP